MQSVTQRQKEIRAGLPFLEQQRAAQSELNDRIKEIQAIVAGDEKELAKIKKDTDKIEVHTTKLYKPIECMQLYKSDYLRIFNFFCRRTSKRSRARSWTLVE